MSGGSGAQSGTDSWSARGSERQSGCRPARSRRLWRSEPNVWRPGARLWGAERHVLPELTSEPLEHVSLWHPEPHVLSDVIRMLRELICTLGELIRVLSDVIRVLRECIRVLRGLIRVLRELVRVIRRLAIAVGV
jgi:hypothetical protein